MFRTKVVAQWPACNFRSRFFSLTQRVVEIFIKNRKYIGAVKFDSCHFLNHQNLFSAWKRTYSTIRSGFIIYLHFPSVPRGRFSESRYWDSHESRPVLEKTCIPPSFRFATGASCQERSPACLARNRSVRPVPRRDARPRRPLCAGPDLSWAFSWAGAPLRCWPWILCTSARWCKLSAADPYLSSRRRGNARRGGCTWARPWPRRRTGACTRAAILFPGLQCRKLLWNCMFNWGEEMLFGPVWSVKRVMIADGHSGDWSDAGWEYPLLGFTQASGVGYEPILGRNMLIYWQLDNRLIFVGKYEIVSWLSLIIY